MSEMISRLQGLSSFSDVTLVLPDQAHVPAHKLVLTLGSEFFQALFQGGLASDKDGTVEIRGVDSTAFRRLLDFIYNSGPRDWMRDGMSLNGWWDLLEAAHVYMVPALIHLCSKMLSDYMPVMDHDTLTEHVGKAYQLDNCEYISRSGLKTIKDKLQEILTSKGWLTLPRKVILDLINDEKLKVRGVYFLPCNIISQHFGKDLKKSKMFSKILNLYTPGAR